MNFKAPLVFGCVMALGLPVGSAVAGGRNAQSFSRPAAARSAPQRATFRGGQNFQRSSSNWTGNNRFNSFSRPNVNRSTFTGNRTVINSNTANWSRFNRTTNRFGTGWNGSRRVGSADFNRWNWRHRHHRDFDNFVFFGGFGFPFYSPWDYTYYPGAYYPYYAYTPYYYDPYSSYNGSSTYVDPGYDNGTSDDPSYDNSGRSRDSRRYDRSGTQNGSVVARVQRQLAQDGYYKGQIDGVAGSRTYYAIRAYQRDHQLSVDGEITDQLLGEMGLR